MQDRASRQQADKEGLKEINVLILVIAGGTNFQHYNNKYHSWLSKYWEEYG